MDKSLDVVIERIINDFGMEILDDRDRFVSAVIDLGGFSDSDRKIIVRTVDDGYLNLCKRALRSDRRTVNAVAERASDYLQREHKLSKEWSDGVTASFVLGLWSVSHPNEEPMARPDIVWKDAPAVHRKDAPAVHREESREWDPSEAPAVFEGRSGFVPDSIHTGHIDPGTRIDPGPPHPRRSMVFPVIAIVAVVLIVGLCIAFWAMSATRDDQDDDASAQGSAVTGEAATETSQEGITEVDDWSAEVIFTDADWDSSTYNGEYCHVDVILNVRNDSECAITTIDFEIDNKEGDSTENVKDGGTRFTADGYIPPNSKGIMVGDVWTYYKKEIPDNSPAYILAAYTNHAIEDYTVPQGRVPDYNEEGDYYNVIIDNPNSVEVSKSAKLVAVDIGEHEFQEADASGTLSEPIPANAIGFVQQKAFVDPGFHSDKDDLTVYAIDSDYYRNCR